MPVESSNELRIIKTEQHAREFFHYLVKGSSAQIQKALEGWTLVFDEGSRNTTPRLGQCRYIEKDLAVSKWLLVELPEEVEETIRHEAAHAACGPGYQHGLKWKMMAKNLGAIPRACYRDHIPQHLIDKIEGKDCDDEPKPPKQVKNWKPKKVDDDPGYVLPVHIYQRDGLFFARQGEAHVADGELAYCITMACAYCEKKKVPLVINFQSFVTYDPETPIQTDDSITISLIHGEHDIEHSSEPSSS